MADPKIIDTRPPGASRVPAHYQVGDVWTTSDGRRWEVVEIIGPAPLRDGLPTQWIIARDASRGRSVGAGAGGYGRCRDCGAYGPRDGAGNGWNCGCAAE